MGNRIVAALSKASCGSAMRRTLLIVLLLGAMIAAPAAAADRIILRNLDVITDRTVESFDLDGIVLDNGNTLQWDEIEKATVANKQEEFDALLKDVGGDLYRIRQRLTVGDYRGLAPHAEALFPRYQQRRSNTAYIVAQSLMWSRLVNGQREEAVEPYLACVECLRKEKRSLPGERVLLWDSETAMSEELVPLWFRPDAARDVLPRVGAMIGTMEKPWPPGVRVYYATLATTAGEPDRAAAALAELNQNEFGGWKTIVQMQLEAQEEKLGTASHQVIAEWPDYQGPLRIAAHYWIGRQLANQVDIERRRTGLLHLLRLPALYGEQHPEIGAAGLFHAMQGFTAINDARSAVAVRSELLERYRQTTFAEQVE